MNIINLILMAPPAGGAQGNPLMQFLPLILIIIVFYFFMIMPQMKMAKAQKAYREGINKGDKIVTIAGIHGKIVDSDESTFVIEVEDKSKMRIDKTAVSMEASQALNNPGSAKKA